MAQRPEAKTVSEGAGTAETQQRPNPNEELVRVFDTDQESEAMVVHGLLESAGIESDMTSLEAQQDILPGVGGTIILVREEDADRARQLIQDSKSAAAQADTAELAVIEDPAGEDPEPLG